MSGAIVVLNGASSAGKSTLAAALRERLGSNATAVSLDRFPEVSPMRRKDWQLLATLSEEGQARDQHERVLQGAAYDLVIDTHALDVDACVERIAATL